VGGTCLFLISIAYPRLVTISCAEYPLTLSPIGVFPSAWELNYDETEKLEMLPSAVKQQYIAYNP
jgi:hypothetical protein